MKIYIAGPMRGIPNFNFPAFFEAEKQLRELGHEVFNPADRDNKHHGTDISHGNHTGSIEQAAQEHGFNLRDALAHDLAYICREAEGIAMLPGWEKSKGAIAEKSAAEAIGIKVIYMRLIDLRLAHDSTAGEAIP